MLPPARQAVPVAPWPRYMRCNANAGCAGCRPWARSPFIGGAGGRRAVHCGRAPCRALGFRRRPFLPPRRSPPRCFRVPCEKNLRWGYSRPAKATVRIPDRDERARAHTATHPGPAAVPAIVRASNARGLAARGPRRASPRPRKPSRRRPKAASSSRPWRCRSTRQCAAG